MTATILGRSTKLWNALVIAVAAAAIATAKAAGLTIDLEMVAADVAVASVLIGIIANEADPTTASIIPGR